MKYLVFIQDELMNNHYIGVYNKLINALPDINKFLEMYNCKLSDLKEYGSVFDTCFDTQIETPDGDIIMVRGFILQDDQLKEVD